MDPYSKILELMKTNSIKFKELDHDPVYTSEEASQVRGLSLDEGAKSLLLKTKLGFKLVVLAGSKKLDSKKLKQALDIKDLRFASPAEVKAQMGCIVGACYPFGSLVGLKTYLDNSLASQDYISFNPGLHHKSIRLKLADYLAVEQPQILDISA